MSNIILLESGGESGHVMAAAESGGVYVWGLNNYGQIGDRTQQNSAYPVAVGSSPVELDNKTIRIEKDSTAELKASTKSQLFSLFDTAFQSASSITWKVLDETVAQITNTPQNEQNGEETTTTAEIKGLKSGSTVIIATDSMTGRTAAAWITVLEAGAVAEPKVAMGNDFAIALRSDGTIWGWGLNDYGKTGVGTSMNKVTTPTQIEKYINPNSNQTFDLNTRFVEIAVGGDHALAIDEDGQLYAWGRNNYGQLGISIYSYGSASVPMLVRDPNGVDISGKAVKVAAGAEFSMVLTTDGYVYSFGRNSKGQLGVARHDSQNPTPVLMRGVEGNGTLGEVVLISAGAEHAMILLGNGMLWTVGDNSQSQLGDAEKQYSDIINQVDTSLSDGAYISKISAGNYNSAFIDNSGNAYVWGSNYNRQMLSSSMGDKYPTVTKINGQGELPDKPIEDIQFGGMSTTDETHTAVLFRDGTLYTWGANSRGQIGNNSHSPLEDKRNYVNTPYNVTVNGGTGIQAVSVGLHNTSVILNDGYVYTWGAEDGGQIGNNVGGQSTDSTMNALVPTKTGEDYITLDKYFLTIKSGDTVQLSPIYNKFFNVKDVTDKNVSFTFGSTKSDVANVDNGGTITGNITGKTSVYIVANRSIFAAVNVTVLQDKDGFNAIPQAKSGSGFTVALDKFGKVYTWGRNDAGQLGDGTRTNRIAISPVEFDFPNQNTHITKIAVGERHTLALDNTGKVWAWGGGSAGQNSWSLLPLPVDTMHWLFQR